MAHKKQPTDQELQFAKEAVNEGIDNLIKNKTAKDKAEAVELLKARLAQNMKVKGFTLQVWKKFDKPISQKEARTEDKQLALTTLEYLQEKLININDIDQALANTAIETHKDKVTATITFQTDDISLMHEMRLLLELQTYCDHMSFRLVDNAKPYQVMMYYLKNINKL